MAPEQSNRHETYTHDASKHLFHWLCSRQLLLKIQVLVLY